MMIIYPLLQAAEDQVTASGLAQEYAGFLAYIGIFGALGFRWLVLSRTGAPADAAMPDEAVRASLRPADSGAAGVGVIGAIFLFVSLLMSVSARAADKGITFGTALAATSGRGTGSFVFAFLFLVLFAVAMKRVRIAWILAAAVGIAYTFRSITSGTWTGLINPLHETAAGLWIGTLFVMVVVGLPVILRSSSASEQRGSLVAEMVTNFSPVAIGASLLLVITGVTTAWRHLKYVAALWTTSYGYALDIKLVFVAIVVALGAWNWKRMRPKLGTEVAAHEIRRSASRELFFAALVLVVTGVLVSLPSPRLPHP